jgi:outer membrane protein
VNCNNRWNFYLSVLGALLFGIVVAWFFCRNTTTTGQNVRIAVMDSSRIKAEAKPFIKVRELIDKEHVDAHKQILEQETLLREELRSIRTSKLGARKKQEMKQEFDKKLALLEQTVLQKKERIVRQFEQISIELESALKNIIEKIVQDKGFHVVLNKYIQETQAILYNEKTLDITDEVIERINKKIPKIQLPDIRGQS